MAVGGCILGFSDCEILRNINYFASPHSSRILEPPPASGFPSTSRASHPPTFPSIYFPRSLPFSRPRINIHNDNSRYHHQPKLSFTVPVSAPHRDSLVQNTPSHPLPLTRAVGWSGRCTRIVPSLATATCTECCGSLAPVGFSSAVRRDAAPPGITYLEGYVFSGQRMLLSRFNK